MELVESMPGPLPLFEAQPIISVESAIAANPPNKDELSDTLKVLNFMFCNEKLVENRTMLVLQATSIVQIYHFWSGWDEKAF